MLRCVFHKIIKTIINDCPFPMYTTVTFALNIYIKKSHAIINIHAHPWIQIYNNKCHMYFFYIFTFYPTISKSFMQDDCNYTEHIYHKTIILVVLIIPPGNDRMF